MAFSRCVEDAVAASGKGVNIKQHSKAIQYAIISVM